MTPHSDARRQRHPVSFFEDSMNGIISGTSLYTQTASMENLADISEPQAPSNGIYWIYHQRLFRFQWEKRNFFHWNLN